MSKTRSFVITNFNLDTENIYDKYKDQIQFIAYGLEKCPTTNRYHHQTFVYFRNPRSTGVKALRQIAIIFGNSHVEPMRGSFAQNESYCSKESALIKLGAEPKQGARGDLMETCQAIKNGTINVDYVALEDPFSYHTYGRTFERIETISLRMKWRVEMTMCKWYWGKTGCGKSHKVFKNYNPLTHYNKDLETKWWDGYKQQDIVIFNEFRGQFTFSFLLNLIDKWPLNVSIRNKESIPFTSKLILITSSVHPKDIYKNILNDEESIAQLERRCKIKQIIRYQ